jgi:two-component system phosphate regulon response regulator PhoB
LLKVLDYNFKQAGHEVLLAPRGSEGLRLARERHPDVVLLDQMLPDVQGTEICRSLQLDPGTRNVPIIFVTAKGDEVDRIVAFELGAVDYVVKPFSVRELVLRVQAILRRTQTVNVSQRIIEFGILRIDEDAHRVWVEGAEIALTLLEFKLLVTLYENRTRVQTRGALLESVWGMEHTGSSRTIDVHVDQLRRKLGKSGEWIKSLKGVGYRFEVD